MKESLNFPPISLIRAMTAEKQRQSPKALPWKSRWFQEEEETDRPTDRDRLPWQKMAAHLADDIKAYIKPAKKAIQPLDGLT